jgi:hypothetical protein
MESSLDKRNVYFESLKQVKWDKAFQNLCYSLGQPLVEIFYGIRKDTIPHFPLLLWGVMFDVLVFTKMDQTIFRLLKIFSIYPSHPYVYPFYCFFGVTLGYWIWGCIQTQRRNNVLYRLTEVFHDTGLVSPRGRLPNLVFDRPIDEIVRRLRITNAYLPKSRFEAARDKIEAALQIYVDDISESRVGGTIDIIYSHFPMTKIVEIENIGAFGSDRFLLGKTRAKDLHGSLLENPHLLIGGQTGGGKSTFLRQLITTLYCNNRNYKFSLIDMKNGLEFQLFEGRERITVFSEVKAVAKLFDRLESELKNRMKVLKENRCKDITEFSAIPEGERLMPAGIPTDIDVLSRHVVVIDEAAELFFASSKRKPEDVQKIVRIATTIAAQGRAVGLHLIIATQKPDANAVNTQIKANLTGIVSFQMATLGASMSIIGCGRATELPSVAGRAIWKAGMEMDEIQTPYMSPDQAKVHLDKISPPKETVVSDQGN